MEGAVVTKETHRIIKMDKLVRKTQIELVMNLLTI